MSYKALYREWRPLAFKDVVEQEHVVKTLKNSVVNNRIAHAYLFCGTRGTGKTTMAKIFSRAINCLDTHDGDPCNKCEVCTGLLDGSLLDVLEIDAASNNSVDNVRQIRDEVAYASAKARFKVYIIDEVHMLSTGAFNALLKTLEEPPSHVVFILATTDPHKLPVTVLSRCQRFDFRRISLESIMGRLSLIAQSSDTKIEEPALRLLARLADGALRDGISLLDQCISLGKSTLTYDDVLEVAGILKDEFISNMIDAIDNGDNEAIISMVDELTVQGKDLQNVVSDLITMCRNIYLCRLLEKPEEVIHLPTEDLNKMKSQCKSFTNDMLTVTIKELSELESSLKWALSPKIMLEVCLIGIAAKRTKQGRNDLEARLAQLESSIASGSFITASQAVKNVTALPENNKENALRPEISKEFGKEKVIVNPKEAGPSWDDLKSISVWKDVKSELRKMNKPSLLTLIDDSKAVFIEEDQVGIFLSDEQSSMAKMIVQKPEHKETLETLLTEKIGFAITVKCFDSSEISQAAKKIDDPFLNRVNEFAKRAEGLVKIID